MAFKGITAFILGNNGEGGGGGGGTSNYNELSNKPQINGNELAGNKSSGDLGIKIGNVPIDGNAYLSDLEKSYNQITPTYTSQTFHGVTFVVNKDKSITANGTADSDITLTVAHFVPSESNLKFSGTPADGSSSKYYLYVVDNVTSEHTVDEYSADPVDIPVSANDCSIKLRIKSGVTCTNVVFKPMVRYSTDPATYIPSYTSNDELESMIGNKVDKVSGKGLSTNDYTDADQEDVAKIDGLVSSVGGLTSRVGIAEGKVRTLEGEMLSVQNSLDTKVDKVTGKSLSTNDYNDTDKGKVDSLGTASTKNSTSVVTQSTDLVESGAVKDIVGWGNDNVDIPTPFVNGVLAWDDSADNIVTNSMYITSPYIPIREDVITISATKGNIVRIYYTDENHNKLYFVGNVPVDGDALTIPKKDGAKYIRFSIGGLGAATYTDYGTKLKANIVYGSEPYHESVSDSLAEKCDNTVIAPTENSATASQDYAVGDYFIKDTILGKTKAPIASGGTFTKDTNYEETNVAKELTELYKYIGILTTPVEAFTANSLPILKRNITNAFYNGSLRAEIAAGNFKNVRPGDYIIGQATGSIYYVVECDYWLGNGDSTNGTTYPAYNTHHLGLMLFKPVGTTALWKGYGYSDKSWRVSASDLGRCPWNAEINVDPTDTEAIGSNSTNITRSYNGTNMSAYMGSFIRERIDAILLPQCFQADFGSENVLKRRNWLSNAINASAASGARSDWQGIASGSVWVDRFIDLASEVELYGSRINSSSRDDIGVQNKQLPIYRNGRIHDFYPRMDLWTKGIASAADAANRLGIGSAAARGASLALWACPLGCVK